MKAVVLTEDGEIALAERPLPVVDATGLLLKVSACGICGTDLHAPSAKAMFADDVVLGHEFAGTVVEVGRDVHGFVPGDGVVVNPIALSCGVCDACRRGFTNQCRVALGSTSGVAKDGGLAEYVVVDRRQAHRVPKTVSVQDAAWTEPLGVAVRAVSLGQLQPGSSVAILGAGPIGQLALQVALAAGAGETLVVESSEYRRNVAQSCGADIVTWPEQVGDVDRLYDAIVDCTGAPAAFTTALSLVGHRGRIVIVGSYSSPISFEPGAAGGKEPLITFSTVYRNDFEFASALRLLERGVVNVKPLTTGLLPLARFDEAFSSLRSAEGAVKLLLDPSLG